MLIYKVEVSPNSNQISIDLIETSDAEVVEQKPEEMTPKQVVDQSDHQLNDEIDPNAKYLSKHNQKVQKQTVAQNRGEFQNIAKSGARGKISLDQFKPSFDITKSIHDRESQERAREEELEKNALLANQKKPTQKSQQTPPAGGDVSQTLDYIPNLDPGLETLLSTREFTYFSYYARIKTQLNQHWGPKLKERLTRLYREGRNIASTENKITKCLVTLDKTGNLVKVQIIGNSGVHDVDEAAVDAFRSAAPFPNPPRGIIDEDGTIKIRWDFILEA
ncbi:MAG: hypothetical protein BroJett040_03620 [Oligoflexia bacterium]|nr:MAG: hypothetical protein BroJett040_03620 [Oligoflexia bacterium]